MCRDCQHARYVARREADPEYLAKTKTAYRQRKYGLTPEAFDAMVIAQQGLCPICGEVPQMTERGMWHVDHDHVTGKVRALLCGNCNRGLGSFKDNPAALQSAIYYLALHEVS